VLDLARAVRRQKRVVLLFLFAIVLPAAALGFFGLRALQADQFRIQALLKREREEALRQAEARVRGRIEQIQGQLRSAIFPEDVPGTLLRVTPQGDFLFVREGYRIRTLERDPRIGAGGPALQEAEELEYQTRDFGSARSRYRILSRDQDPYIRSLGLIGLARTSLRSGQKAEALSAYRRLVREVPSELERETAAHALLAGLQIASIEDGGVEETVAAYRLLVKDRWILCSQIADFYAAELERAIEERCRGASGPRCKEYPDLRAARDDRLRAIQSFEDLYRRLSRALGSFASSELARSELVLEIPESGAVVVAVRASEEARASVVDQEVLARLPSESGMVLRIANSRGDAVYGPAEIPESVEGDTLAFAGDELPSWTLTAFQESSASLLAGRRYLYFGLTVVLALWLLFGALLTARSLRQQMELVGMKTELVSLVSHEFKSPITSLRALLDGLLGGSVTDPERERKYLVVARSELQRLTRLVNNLLDFSRIEAGTRRYRLAPTNLEVMLRDLLLHFEARAAELGFRIETRIEPVPEVDADADAVSQAVLNLLDNAVKNSDGRKRIEVRLASDEGQVVLEVSDEGRGLRPEDVKKVFEKSFHTESAFDGRGLGLGLPIVKHVMEAHGGSVEVRSKPEEGSAFRLLFPTREATAHAAPSR
jgi:signal transduction histidine kinase